MPIINVPQDKQVVVVMHGKVQLAFLRTPNGFISSIDGKSAVYVIEKVLGMLDRDLEDIAEAHRRMKLLKALREIMNELPNNKVFEEFSVDQIAAVKHKEIEEDEKAFLQLQIEVKALLVDAKKYDAENGLTSDSGQSSFIDKLSPELRAKLVKIREAADASETELKTQMNTPVRQIEIEDPSGILGDMPEEAKRTLMEDMAKQYGVPVDQIKITALGKVNVDDGTGMDQAMQMLAKSMGIEIEPGTSIDLSDPLKLYDPESKMTKERRNELTDEFMLVCSNPGCNCKDSLPLALKGTMGEKWESLPEDLQQLLTKIEDREGTRPVVIRRSTLDSGSNFIKSMHNTASNFGNFGPGSNTRH